MSLAQAKRIIASRSFHLSAPRLRVHFPDGSMGMFHTLLCPRTKRQLGEDGGTWIPAKWVLDTKEIHPEIPKFFRDPQQAGQWLSENPEVHGESTMDHMDWMRAGRPSLEEQCGMAKSLRKAGLRKPGTDLVFPGMG